MGVRNREFRDEVADGEERIEALSNGPRETGAFSVILDVAARHIDRDEVAFQSVSHDAFLLLPTTTVRL